MLIIFLDYIGKEINLYCEMAYTDTLLELDLVSWTPVNETHEVVHSVLLISVLIKHEA